MNWEHALKGVARTPSEYHRPVDAAFARAVLRCSDADLETLSSTTIKIGDGLFDAFDIWNLGLYSNSRASRPELEMAYLRRLLSSGGDLIAPVDYRFTLEAACPNGSECDSALWSRPEIIGSRWTGSAIAPGVASWTGELRQLGKRSTILCRSADIIWRLALSSYRYHYTSPDLAANVSMTRRRRVGDCTALSELLAAELTEQGIQSRSRSGFLWGGHTARVHRWVEAVDADGQWKSLDLSMALLAGRFLPTSYREFCFGNLPNRVIHASLHTGTVVRHQCSIGALRLEPVVRRAHARIPDNSISLYLR